MQIDFQQDYINYSIVDIRTLTQKLAKFINEDKPRCVTDYADYTLLGDLSNVALNTPINITKTMLKRNWWGAKLMPDIGFCDNHKQLALNAYGGHELTIVDYDAEVMDNTNIELIISLYLEHITGCEGEQIPIFLVKWLC